MTRGSKLVVFGTIILALAVLLGVETNHSGLTLVASGLLAFAMIGQTLVLNRLSKKMRVLKA